MANTNGCEKIELTKYVKCEYHNGTTITIGHVENGSYLMSIEKKDNNVLETISKNIVPEEYITGVLATILLYGQTYGIDFTANIKRFFEAENMFYYCQEKD